MVWLNKKYQTKTENSWKEGHHSYTIIHFN